MIDLRHETLVPLRDVPRLLPPRPTGKRIHISAVYRWAQRGRGGMKLDSVRIGGTAYTSREALQRFAEAKDDGEPAHPQPRLSARRSRRIEAAQRKVQAILNTPSDKSHRP